MKHSLPVWLSRLLLAASGLWACNSITGADSLTIVEAEGGQGAQGAGDAGGGPKQGGGGKGGSGADDDDDDDNSGPSGGRGGSGSGSNIACSSTTKTHDECRACCRDERRGTDATLEADVVADIEDCICDAAPSCAGLTGDCADCCKGICAGQKSIDNTITSKCTTCLSGVTCSGLSSVCGEQPKACSALFGCFHDCQQIAP
jgi:hypothetical protein